MSQPVGSPQSVTDKEPGVCASGTGIGVLGVLGPAQRVNYA